MAPRVLVVDDDRALQVLLNVLLTRAGFNVEFASTGTEAVEKLDGDGDGSYKAVLLDLILPELGGTEILDHLALKNPSLLPRVILLTSASRGILEKIDHSRIHSVIRKPFDIQEVIRRTADCAGR